MDCIVTSPPYYGLRDYGHSSQIGLEGSPDAYVQAIVAVFTEVRRVLKDGGTVFLNIGDSYTSMLRSGREESPGVGAKQELAPVRNAVKWGSGGGTNFWWRVPAFGGELKPKDLMGIPWRVAFALQADGWYLRSDIIWHKPNPMPESVTDRPTKSHEYVFLLAKQERYYYDAAAIAEPSVDPESLNGRNRRYDDHFVQADPDGFARTRVGFANIEPGKKYLTRNRRSVWTIPTRPFPFSSGSVRRERVAWDESVDDTTRITSGDCPVKQSHFATMPEALVEPCILAGCPMGGLVLDPFSGSGTVLAVASRLGRRGVGVDLNPAYHALAKVRTAQRGLRFTHEDATAHETLWLRPGGPGDGDG